MPSKLSRRSTARYTRRYVPSQLTLHGRLGRRNVGRGAVQVAKHALKLPPHLACSGGASGAAGRRG